MTIKSILSEALRRWDEDAKAGNFPERTDDERFDDSAQSLLDYMAENLDPRLVEALGTIGQQVVKFKDAKVKYMAEQPQDFEDATADDFVQWFAEFGMDAE